MASSIDRRGEKRTHIKGVPSNYDRAPEARATEEEIDSFVADVTREEVTAKLEASEARVATAVEAMRGDNDRLRHQIDSAVESMKSSAEAARLEMSSFRSEMLRAQSVSLSETKEAVHNLRAWVLAGALTAAVTVLGIFASNYLKPTATLPPPQASQAPLYVTYPQTQTTVPDSKPSPALTTEAPPPRALPPPEK